MRTPRLLASLLLVASAATGCSAAAGDTPSAAVRVVASTNVYADIVSELAAGLSPRRVSVTALIDNPSQDPHDFEPTVADELALARANVVIENGGGYDDFVDRMLSASSSSAAVVNAVDVSGVRKIDGQLNEHVWYNAPAMFRVVQAIAHAMAHADRTDALTFALNRAVLRQQINGIERFERHIKADYGGESVLITEPLPLYMIRACGLINRTPTAVSNAIEDSGEISVRALASMMNLLRHHKVKALIYNAQTATSETQSLVDAATNAGVPVVPLTETLPPLTTYIHWMQDNLHALHRALAQ